jgi:hypothetical protein
VGDVDEVFKCQGEAVLHEARGDEGELRGAEADVAMADGAVAEVDVVGGRDGSLVFFSYGEGHKVPGAAREGLRDDGGHGQDDALEIFRRNLRLPVARVKDAVGGLLDVRLLRHLSGGEQGYLGGINHKLVF